LLINLFKKEQSTIQVTNGKDTDPLETEDCLESLSAVISKDGNQRPHFLIKELINKAYREGANIPYTQNTPYINQSLQKQNLNQMEIKILREELDL